MHRIDGTELAIGDEHERMLADVKDLQAAYVALLSAPDNANLQQAYLQALERFGPEGWAASRIAK